MTIDTATFPIQMITEIGGVRDRAVYPPSQPSITLLPSLISLLPSLLCISCLDIIGNLFQPFMLRLSLKLIKFRSLAIRRT